MDWLGGAISAVGNFVSAKQAAETNSAMLDKQIAWQDLWRRTAHQTEVADLRAAGLNPILTATGGKGAPMGSPGSASGGVDARLGSAATEGATAASVRRLQDQQRQREWYATERERWDAESAKNEADASEFEAKVGVAMARGIETAIRNGASPEVIAEARRRMADARAGSTAADIERELDETSGEFMRSLRRLGITGSTATELIKIIRGQQRTPRIPNPRPAFRR